MRYRETLTVPITLDRAGSVPLHEQIAGQFGTAIRTGSLAAGTRMPSTRTLSVLLGVSRGVVAAGYDVLVARGFAEGREGSGTYVLGERRTVLSAAARRPATVVDLTPGLANAEIFPLAAWRSAWRQASSRVPLLAGAPALGLPALRTAIADHLLRTRGLAPAGHVVVVTGGTVPGLRLALDALDAVAADRADAAAGPGGGPAAVAVEEYGVAAGAVAGREVVRLPVDAEGVRVHALPRRCRAVVLSTEGHVGWGAVLSSARRTEVALWAARTGGTPVELVCDAVFRPASDRPRLLDLAPGTVLVGGFCAALTPALRLGYLVVPRELAPVIGRIVTDRGEQPPYVTQLAVAHLLADGTVTRLMHRRGRLLRERLGAVTAALGRAAVEVAGVDAVGSVLVRLPEPVEAAAVSELLRLRGVTVPAADRRTLTVGYGHLDDDALRAGLAALVDGLTAIVGPAAGAADGRVAGRGDDLAA